MIGGKNTRIDPRPIYTRPDTCIVRLKARGKGVTRQKRRTTPREAEKTKEGEEGTVPEMTLSGERMTEAYGSDTKVRAK